MPEKPPVIVVNSLVSRGSVGGRASVFALERLGFPVVFLPTVLLPWHPGHGPGTRVIPPEGLSTDIGRAVDDARLGGILSGYFGNSYQIAGLIGTVIRARRFGRPLYLCDPVLGDAGRFYVHYQTYTSIRDDLVPFADIVTPNRFELSFLAGQDFNRMADNADLVAAARSLGRPEVVVTSAFAGPGETGNLLVTPDRAELMAHPAVAHAPHGAGDLLAALYLGHRLGGASPREALERATGATLRLVELAAGAAELPLAAGQEAFFAPPAGIRVEAVGDG
jgi:pyridoxine kinase